MLVFLFIDREPEEIQVMADGAPGSGGVFADAAGKDQRVQAAHLHNIAADSGANALSKQRERQGCLTITAVRRLLDIAIIVRDAGNAQQAGLVIQQLIQLLRRFTLMQRQPR